MRLFRGGENKPSFVSFRVMFSGCNINFIQNKREKIIYDIISNRIRKSLCYWKYKDIFYSCKLNVDVSFIKFIKSNLFL